MAELLRKINISSPLAVGLDFIFSEPDGTSPKSVYKGLSERLGIQLKNVAACIIGEFENFQKG